MNKPLPSLHILAFAAGILAGFPSASPAQVKVLMSGGFSAAYQDLLPEFQNTTGITVTTAHGASQGDAPNTIGAQLRRGVAADMVILSRGGLAELIAEGRIATGSEVNLAQVPLGVGVRAGAPRPNIGTVDAFKQALLRAKSVGTQSSSTIYMTSKLFPQLGIASAMAGKLSDGGPADVPSGKLEMVVSPVSEILPTPGVDFVGTIPAEIQFVQVFAAAVLKDAKEPETSKRLIAFLASEKATAAIEKMGMKRPDVSPAPQKLRTHSFLKSPSRRGLAPDFNLKDASGKDVKLADLKGKVVLVNFWATWCEGCQVEIPWFIEFQADYAKQGLVVVGISLDDDGWKSVKPWIQEKKVNYPIVIGSEGLAKQYGLGDGMPLTALVDREGRIAHLHTGVVEKMATQQRIRDLLQESFKNPAI